MEDSNNVAPGAADAPPRKQKYGVFRALNDLFNAIQRNLGTFLLSVALAYVGSVLVYMLIVFIIDSLPIGDFGLFGASTGKLIMVVGVSITLYWLWYAFAVAFTTASISLPVYDKTLKLSDVMNRSIAVLPRVVKTNLLVGLVIFLPIVLLGILSFFSLYGSLGTYGSSGIAGGVLGVILTLAAFIWVLIAMLRYALAPLVAIFEPEVPISKTLALSQHLLTKGGQWFIFKGAVLIFIIVLVLSGMSGSTGTGVLDSDNLGVNLVLIMVSILAQGAVVMLYQNRRMVRG